MELSGERHNEWIELEAKKRHDLEGADLDPNALVTNLEALKQRMDELLRSSPRVVDRLNPALDHIRSFADAITSASQYTPLACLIWGVVQVVMEAAHTRHHALDEVADLMEQLTEPLPEFKSYVALFPNDDRIHWALQDLYQEVLTFLTSVTQYFERPWPLNLMLNLIWATPKNNLETTKRRIRGHIDKFRKAAQLAHRKMLHVRQVNVERTLGEAMQQDLFPLQPKKRLAIPDEIFPLTTVRMFRNQSFRGRDQVLARIFRLFSPLQPEQAVEHDVEGQVLGQAVKASKRTPVACCVLHGLGGIGKTQCALQYYYSFRADFDAIFWVESEIGWNLASSYARIADSLQLMEVNSTGSAGNKYQELAIEKARAWLETTDRRWLLIFDNVEDVNDLGRYLPIETRGKGCVILTTQNPHIDPITEVFENIQIDPLDRDVAGTLLFRFLEREAGDDNEAEQARSLSDLVGGSPLAIATCGGYIKQSQVGSLAEFVDTLSRSSHPWKASHKLVGPVTQYDRTLQTVFQKAFDDLSEEAFSLISILAFLNPDSIPEELFEKAIEKKLLPWLKQRHDLVERIRELRQRQLIKREPSKAGPFLMIHRTVQYNILLRISEDFQKRRSRFDMAFALVRNVLPEANPLTVPEPEKWPSYEKYGQQILDLRTHCLWPEPAVELCEDFGQVLADMGTFMWHAGRFTEAEAALETAEAILDDNETKASNPLRANIYSILGIISSFEGVSQRERSMEYRYKAIASRDVSLGQIPSAKRSREQEMLLWNVKSDLAYGLVQEEDFLGARKIMEGCLEQYKKWDNEDNIPYEYSKYYQIVSCCLMAEQQPEVAIEAITKCVSLMTKTAGVKHSMTQLMWFITGTLTWHAGLDQKASEIHVRVLEARKEVLGEFNQFTLESYSTCGRLYAKARRYEDARRCFKTCLQQRKHAIWNEEGVARAQFWYCQVLDHLMEQEKDELRRNALLKEASEMRAAVQRVLARYRQGHGNYFRHIDIKDDEAVLDQMVSLWAGRFTGNLRQSTTDVGFDMKALEINDNLDESKSDSPPPGQFDVAQRRTVLTNVSRVSDNDSRRLSVASPRRRRDRHRDI